MYRKRLDRTQGQEFQLDVLFTDVSQNVLSKSLLDE